MAGGGGGRAEGGEETKEERVGGCIPAFAQADGQMYTHIHECMRACACLSCVLHTCMYIHVSRYRTHACAGTSQDAGSTHTHTHTHKQRGAGESPVIRGRSTGS